MTLPKQTTHSASAPDLHEVALVRLGTPETVARLVRCGARVLAEGDHMDALVIAGTGEPDREGVLDGVVGGWVLVRTASGRRVLVVLMPEDEVTR